MTRLCSAYSESFREPAGAASTDPPSPRSGVTGGTDIINRRPPARKSHTARRETKESKVKSNFVFMVIFCSKSVGLTGDDPLRSLTSDVRRLMSDLPKADVLNLFVYTMS